MNSKIKETWKTLVCFSYVRYLLPLKHVLFFKRLREFEFEFEFEIDFWSLIAEQCSHSAIFSLTLTRQYPILFSPQPSVSEPWRLTLRLFSLIDSPRSVTQSPMLPEKLSANTSGRTSTLFTNMISVSYLFSFLVSF